MKGLMKIVRKAGGPTTAELIAGLEGKLDTLSLEGSNLVAKIDDFAAANDQHDDPDKILAGIAGIKAAENRLRKIDFEIADIRDQLDLARSTARAEQLAALRAELATAAEDFHTKSTILIDAVQRLQAARQAIFDAGFKSEYNSFPPPPMIGRGVILDPDLVDLFAANYARVFNPTLQVNRQQPLHRPSIAAAPVPARAAPPSPTRLTAPKRPPLRETAGEGQSLIVILRSGVESATHGQLQNGDVIAVDRLTAIEMLHNGAADWADPVQVDATALASEAGQ